jgi:hypothetical protein
MEEKDAPKDKVPSARVREVGHGDIECMTGGKPGLRSKTSSNRSGPRGV